MIEMKRIKKSQNGFTLLELLVVITIMIIIFSTSIMSYDKMGQRIELENAAYNLAITVREAQSYGINKRARTIGNPDFGENYRYGVYFDITGMVSGISDTKFIIYLDRPDPLDEDNKFTSAGGSNCTGSINDECYSQVLLTRGTHITDIYLYGGTGWETTHNSVDISFVRPNPDAEIIDSIDDRKSRARIILQNRGENAYYCVEIGTAGDISIKGGANNCILP